MQFLFRTCIPLQGFDKHGRRVLILRGGKADPDRFSMIDQFRANLMVNELLMKDCEDAQGKVDSLKIRNSITYCLYLILYISN